LLPSGSEIFERNSGQLMNRKYRFAYVPIMLLLLAGPTTSQVQTSSDRAVAQSTGQAQPPSDKRESISGVHASAANQVTGSGTPGRISKWNGASGSSTFTIGDSNILEDKFGKVGINTASPTSPLTVQGMIETTLGGYKFPDGTIQTTAAAGLQFVVHDSTLRGDGTSGSPLGVRIPPDPDR
jgi:hypothetical protein